MTDEAIQTPQGEVGASEGVKQSASADEKKTSLLGAEQEPVSAEEQPKAEGEKPEVEGKAEEKADGEDEGTELKDEEKEKDGAPEAYADFTLPEGMELDSKAMEKAAPLFKELGLSQDKAQKLVDQYAELVQGAAEQQRQAVDKMRDEWANEIKSDPEHKKTLADAKKAVEAFGDDTLKGLLYDNWLGDHPAMVKFLGRIGSAMNNDKFIEGHAALDDKGRLDRIYDKM